MTTVPLVVTTISKNIYSESRVTPGPAADPPTPPLNPLDLPLGGEPWTALYTLSRREKQVARACTRLGVRHYLPLNDRRPSPGSRVYAVPLFPSYVFACLAPAKRVALLETGAIARVIRIDRPAELLEELRQIRTAITAGADLVPGLALDRGMRVRVNGGPLAGVEGLVADRRRRAGRLKLVLNVTFLGRSAAAEIDACDVEPAPDPRGWDAGGNPHRLAAAI